MIKPGDIFYLDVRFVHLDVLKLLKHVDEGPLTGVIKLCHLLNSYVHADLGVLSQPI